MNKNIIRHILSALVAVLSLSACEIETNDNGKLDGFWHVERIDTITTGGTTDMSHDLLFWSVQSRLLELSNRNTDIAYIFTFSHSGGKLTIANPRLSDRSKGDPEVEDAEPLHPFGVNKLAETFEVEALTGSKLLLKSETLRISLRKF